MQGLRIYCRKWTTEQSPPSKGKSQTLVPAPHPSVAIITSEPLRQHQTGHCRFCSKIKMWPIEETKAAYPASGRGRKTTSFWERQYVLGQGKLWEWEVVRANEGLRHSWGHSWGPAESSRTGCSNHTPAQPQCKIWSSPNSTKTGCSERILEDRSHFWCSGQRGDGFTNISHSHTESFQNFCSNGWGSSDVYSTLMSRQIPSNLWPP